MKTPKWPPVAVVVLLAAALAAAYAALTPGAGAGQDNVGYVYYYKPVTDNILAGRGAMWWGGRPFVYVAGYPVFLAAVYGAGDALGLSRPLALVIVNVILTAATAALVFALGNAVFGRRVGLLAAALWAACPWPVWLAAQPNPEVPFLTLVAAGFYSYVAAVKEKGLVWAAGAAAWFAAAAAIRPAGLGLALAFAAAALVTRALRRRWAVAAVVALGTVAVAAPWQGRSWLGGGERPSVGGGLMMNVMKGLTFGAGGRAAGAFPAPSPRAVALMDDVERTLGYEATFGELARYIGREASGRRLGAFAEVAALKAARSWYGRNSFRHERAVALVQGVYLALGLAGLVVAGRLFRERRVFFGPLVAAVFYFWFVTFTVWSMLRYMVPAMLVVMLFAGVAVDMVISRLTERKPARRLL